MKNIYYILILLLFTTATQAQNIPSYVPTNGLVGWWPFNGNANDESGNGNHGTVNGATLTSDRNGVVGKAYSFDGIDDNIIINNPFYNISLPHTLSMWVKIRDVQKIGQYLWNTTPHAGEAFVYNWYSSNYNVTSCIGNSTSWNVTCGSFYSSLKNANNVWCLYTMTYYNGIWSIFINGVLVNTLSSSNLSSGIYSLVFGDITSGINHESINGILDDIAIYNRALTQQEITALYSGVVSYNFTASSGPNGSITPTGTTTLNQGSTQSFTFSPNTGYLVDSVIVDGNKVDSIQGYTFSNISSNHSIRVSFKIDSNNVSMNFPTGISYQAVARDSAGKVLENKPIKLRFSIKENSMNGNTVYTETANLTTNKLGLFTCIIGNNNAILGNYKNIDWMGASKFLQVELGQAGNYVLLGSQQLLSVPYANAANKANTANQSNESKKIKNASLPIYPDNNAALQGGLQAGEMYRTNAGVLMIVY